jgi:hypothetical protein
MKTVIFVNKNDSPMKFWDKISAIGSGFVNISNPETLGLLPGVPSSSGIDSYSVSMFHQLHCLVS